MFITKLGLRNLFRHKKRTVITAILISLAILIYLVTDSLMTGMAGISFDNIINLESGHIQVADPEYWEEKDELPLENMIIVSDQLKSEIQKTNQYQAMAEQLRFSARLNNGIDEMPVTAIGIKPAQHQQVFTTENYIMEGHFLKSGKYQAVLGKSLAKLMGLSIGDYITLLVRTEGGTFNTIDLEISGLLKTPNPSINNNTVYLPLDIAQQSLNVGNKVSQIVLRFDTNRDKVEPIVRELNEDLNALDIDVQGYSWRKSAGTVIAFSEAQSVETVAILSIILLIAAVGIVNTTILAALERMKEIGMMKALGLKESEIVRAFMVEAAGIGIIGGLIGWILSIAGVYYLTEIGISFSQLAGEELSFGMPIVDVIYGTWNIPAFIFIFVFGVVVAVLSSILPALWAAKKDPIKAIYHK